jgi:lipoprotein-anchoring transpeptidase ErfK/SrfK
VLRTLAAIVAAAGLAAAAAPASEQMPAIARGVDVAGVSVARLSAEPARARIDAAFSQPVTIVAGKRQETIVPAAVDAKSNVDAAVSSALAATPGSRIALPVTYSRPKAAKLVALLAARYDRAPVDAKVVGAAALERLLRDGTRTPLKLITRAVPARRTTAHFGPILVVTRGINTLRLYDGKKLVRTFPVATGQSIYPTPAGIWHIADKQRDPWWYPPTYDTWAKGLKPVPPGPSNPLGTRWMGLDAPGVGIHGTDAPTSIGYSASHGCVRMHVPDAEWLFEHVSVGTPVVIL